MSTKKVRWGILGAANIARRNWQAIRHTGNSIVSAVASRDPARARQFIAECQAQAPMEALPRAAAGYDALVKDAEVDAVYIPLPTGVRKEWVIRAAEAGKHVLCEKPCAASTKDLREMIEACRRNGVQFMDGVMFMHNGRLPKVREAIHPGLGELRRITSAFSFRGDAEFFASNIRASSALEPFGCLGDLGWYCIRLALWAADYRLPLRVTGRILSEKVAGPGLDPVPSEFSGELFFDHGLSSSFYCSFLTEVEQWAHFSGTNGLLRLDDFVLSFFGDEIAFEASNPFFNIQGCDFNMERHTRRIAIPEYSNSHPTAQDTCLFRNFAALVLAGRREDHWPDIALKTQQVMAACLASAKQGGAVLAVAE